MNPRKGPFHPRPLDRIPRRHRTAPEATGPTSTPVPTSSTPSNPKKGGRKGDALAPGAPALPDAQPLRVGSVDLQVAVTEGKKPQSC